MVIFLIIIFLVIGHLVLKSTSKDIVNSRTSLRKSPSSNKEVQYIYDIWLEDRWKLAQEQKISGINGIFPEWYFDEVTERQIKKLNELSISFSKNITKGQASDLIGMQEPVDNESIKVLKFFKIKTAGINKVQARHKVALIFENKENAKKWKERPPAQYQKEFFKFFGSIKKKTN